MEGEKSSQAGLVCQGEDESPDPWQLCEKCEVWGPTIWICRSVGTCGGQHEISTGNTRSKSSLLSSQSAGFSGGSSVWWRFYNNLINRATLHCQDDPSSHSLQYRGVRPGQVQFFPGRNGTANHERSAEWSKLFILNISSEYCRLDGVTDMFRGPRWWNICRLSQQIISVSKHYTYQLGTI